MIFCIKAHDLDPIYEDMCKTDEIGRLYCQISLDSCDKDYKGILDVWDVLSKPY